jgi:5-hydroxyisourate hydrolase
MSVITTHVLDTVLGKPAAGISVRLEKQEGSAWAAISTGATDVDGRCRDLAPNAEGGVYRLTFDTGTYLKRNGRSTIYPEISITFICGDDAHYHLPLLLSDNSYTTYRGS